jgi:hypothetical protein
MNVSTEHTSAGCNRTVGVVSCGPGSLVAYAAHSAVLLYDSQVRASWAHGVALTPHLITVHST